MDHVDNVGSYLEDNKMVWKRQISAGPDRLWSAVATRDGLSHWFMPTKFEMEEGGRFSFENGWDGTISEIGPRHHVRFDKDGDGGAYLRFEIEANDRGCLFSLVDRMGAGADAKEKFPSTTPADRLYQPGGPGTHWSGVAAGYHGFVDSLEGHITGTKTDSNYDDMCRTYQTVLDDYFGRARS